MNDSEYYNKYYVIFSIIISESEERLYPLIYEDKKDSDHIMDELSNDSINIRDLSSSFGTDYDGVDIKILPFLYIEKSIISSDSVYNKKTLLGTSSGGIDTEFIPMDYVSNVYFKNRIKNIVSSKYIDLLISEAMIEL